MKWQIASSSHQFWYISNTERHISRVWSNQTSAITREVRSKEWIQMYFMINFYGLSLLTTRNQFSNQNFHSMSLFQPLSSPNWSNSLLSSMKGNFKRRTFHCWFANTLAAKWNKTPIINFFCIESQFLRKFNQIIFFLEFSLVPRAQGILSVPIFLGHSV